jgi:hypothetical protein
VGGLDVNICISCTSHGPCSLASYPDVPYTCQRDHPAASLVTGTAETGGTRDCGRKVALARGDEMVGRARMNGSKADDDG